MLGRFLVSLNQFGRVIRSAFDAFNANKGSSQGAALSFFMVFALPPLLVLLVLIASQFVDDALIHGWLLAQARHGGGKLGGEMVEMILTHATRPDPTNVFAGGISVVMLIFSATGIFAQLQDCLNTIWGVKVRPEASIQRMITARVISFALIVAIGVLILLTILLDVGLAVVENLLTRQFSILSTVHFFQNLNRGTTFVGMTLLFAALFKFLPDVRILWRDVLAGAFFTSLALTLSKFLISWFLSSVNLGSAYGTMGSLIVFLFWLHINMQIFLFGAEFTEALATYEGAPVRPRDYAMWLPGRTPPAAPPAEM